MTYKEAGQYLDSFINYEKKDKYDYKTSFKLDRMKRLCAILGNPQHAVKSIHIAGTKGKGSTSAIIHSILKEAGYRTGLYTSPHLSSFRERIRIDDSMIAEDDICRLSEKIKTALENFKDDLPSFFEVYTALAFLYFKENKADIVVYETGLGGRLDATNLISPLVTAITPISYDHTDKLGASLKEIASEKGGIIKEGIACVSAPQEIEACLEIERICREKKSHLTMVGRDIMVKIKSANLEKQSFDVVGALGKYSELETKLLGAHQAINTATAIGVVESLRSAGFAIPDEAIRRGVLNCKWPGRLEIAARHPFIVLDGAQNRASANALASAIKELFVYKKLILVLGISKDKDIKGILEELMPISQTIIVTKSNVVNRACEPKDIAEVTGSKKGRMILTKNVPEAISRAKELADKEDLILVTGSLFVVGEVREILK